MNDLQGFTFLRSYYDCLRKVDKDTAYKLYQAICAYMFTGNEPTFDGDVNAEAFWELIRPNLDSTRQKIVAGRKGGAPAGNNNASKTSEKQAENKHNSSEKQAENKQPTNTPFLKDKDIRIKEKEKECMCVGRTLHGTHTHTQDFSPDVTKSDFYTEFWHRIETNYPTVAQLQPPSEKWIAGLQQQLAKQEINYKDVWHIIQQMENNPQLLERNKLFTGAYNKFRQCEYKNRK